MKSWKNHILYLKSAALFGIWNYLLKYFWLHKAREVLTKLMAHTDIYVSKLLKWELRDSGHCVQSQGQALLVLTQKKVSLSSVYLIDVLGIMIAFKISLIKWSNVFVSLCEKYLELGSSATVERAVSVLLFKYYPSFQDLAVFPSQPVTTLRK